MSERVSLDDIESKLRDIGGDAQSSVTSAMQAPPVLATGAIAASLLIAAVYVLGRRRGRKQAPVLEIRRI